MPNEFKVKNGLITPTVTATGVISGSELTSTLSSGDEGGQINLAKPVTNTTINTGVAIDVFQNRIRFYETGGTNRGFYIDVTSGGAGGATNLVSTGSSSVSIGTSAPGSPTAGTLWWDSTYGQLKIYYSDGTSSQWVDANSISSNKFVTTFASPAPIGSTTPNTIAGTTITATTSISAPTVTGTTIVEATADKTGSGNRGAFAYGTLGYNTTNALVTAQSSVNSYNQNIIQNTSSGTAASSDFVVNNNLSTDSTYYGNFGMNSSGWTGTIGTASLSAPNITYLTSTSADLVIGTTTSNHIRFVVGGGSDIIIFDTNGDVGLSVQNPTAQLHIAASSATANTAPLKFDGGTLMTAAEAGAFEYDGSYLYHTPTTATGRGHISTHWGFRLTANGSALGPTIADYFGSNSSLLLEASSVYEITAYVHFLKTTAGTVTWTWAASNAPTHWRSYYVGTVATGYTTTTVTGTPVTGMAVVNGGTTLVHAATGSLTTAVNHAFEIKLYVVTASAPPTPNIRLRVTSSAGTVTPQAGSFYVVRRISPSTGAFTA